MSEKPNSQDCVYCGEDNGLMFELHTVEGEFIQKYHSNCRLTTERIIKLLETKPAELMCCTCGMDELIALIKEENK